MRILIERKGQGCHCDTAWLAQGLLALPMAVGAATS
jgi:hypothetical protein